MVVFDDIRVHIHHSTYSRYVFLLLLIGKFPETKFQDCDLWWGRDEYL